MPGLRAIELEMDRQTTHELSVVERVVLAATLRAFLDRTPSGSAPECRFADRRP